LILEARRKQTFLDHCRALAELHPDWKAARVEAEAKNPKLRGGGRQAVPGRKPAERRAPARREGRWKVRAAGKSMPGVHTFYIASARAAGPSHVAQHVRRAGQRRWFCDCADFTFRRLAQKRHCKHLRYLAARARQARGISKLIAD